MISPATSPTPPEPAGDGRTAEVVDLNAWRSLPWARLYARATLPSTWQPWEYECVARRIAGVGSCFPWCAHRPWRDRRSA